MPERADEVAELLIDDYERQPPAARYLKHAIAGALRAYAEEVRREERADGWARYKADVEKVKEDHWLVVQGLKQAAEEARREEREACAMFVERMGALALTIPGAPSPEAATHVAETCAQIAISIRARGEKG